MIKERIANLLTVKSIVTIILSVLVAYLAVTGELSGQEVLTVYTVIIGFYFGTQAEKKNTTEPQAANTNDV